MTLGVILGLQSTSKLTIFIVNKFSSNTTGFILAKRDHFSDGKGWNVVMWNGAYLLEIYVDQVSNFVKVGTMINLNSTYLSALTYNGSLSSAGANLWINGTKLTSPARAGTLPISPKPDGDEDLRIGAREGNSMALYHGSIGEIIIFNDLLSDDDIKEVNKYLSSKWGIK
jgi:hypothetical protein